MEPSKWTLKLYCYLGMCKSLPRPGNVPCNETWPRPGSVPTDETWLSPGSVPTDET